MTPLERIFLGYPPTDAPLTPEQERDAAYFLALMESHQRRALRRHERRMRRVRRLIDAHCARGGS